jgi:hypothetical protein
MSAVAPDRSESTGAELAAQGEDENRLWIPGVREKVEKAEVCRREIHRAVVVTRRLVMTIGFVCIVYSKIEGRERSWSEGAPKQELSFFHIVLFDSCLVVESREASQE